MSKQQSTNEFEYDHSVTSTNTAMHWILYALDAWESNNPDDRRERGATPYNVYDYASDDDNDSLVFAGDWEVRSQMKTLFQERGALERRTEQKWYEMNADDPHYRLNEEGRKALLDLGIPEYLPNRRDPEHERELPMEPSHEPGWWLEDDDQPDYDVEEGWEISDNDWLQSGANERVFFYDAGDRELCEGRGYTKLGNELANAFPDTTFVLTCGPYRMHDLMFRVRDPFQKVVQIDVYSPMAMHRETEEITDAFSALVKDLHHSLQQATEEFEDE